MYSQSNLEVNWLGIYIHIQIKNTTINKLKILMPVINSFWCKGTSDIGYSNQL